jgi:hypothetical protein
MLPSCLDNFIGVKCLSANPKSGLWINDLEGINIRMAADIADSGYISGLQLLEQKINFASQLVIQELSGFVLPYFRINSSIDELLVGDFNSNYLAASSNDRGIKAIVKNTRMMRIFVGEVKIRIQQANSTHSFQIIDGLNSTSFSFDTDANGEATVFANYISSNREIYIVMDNTSINPADTDVKSGCSCSSKSSQFMSVNGWNGSGVANNSYGIKAQLTAECKIDEMICIIAQQLRFPILYKAGLEIVKEAKATDRLNSVTLLDNDKINFLYEEFTNQYNNHMKLVVNQLPELMKRIDDICVICNQSRYVYGNP